MKTPFIGKDPFWNESIFSELYSYVQVGIDRIYDMLIGCIISPKMFEKKVLEKIYYWISVMVVALSLDVMKGKTF